MTPRAVIGGAVLIVVLLALSVAGRWEGERAVDGQLRQMRTAFDVVGGQIDAPILSAFRAGPPVCFYYDLGGEPFAIGLCFDDEGRLVETSDRRGSTPVYSTIAHTPERAAVVVDPARIDALLEVVAAG